MPSDSQSPQADRFHIALAAVTGRIAVFRSTITTALERVSTRLATGGGADRARIELGAMAHGRIDAARFAELSTGAALDSATRTILERAAELLSEIAELENDAYVMAVPVDEDVGAQVDGALAYFGRAFAAIRAVEFARIGAFDEAKRELAGRRGFDRWTNAERAVAPPLVVITAGSSLNAGALAAVLDGTVHLALVIEGNCQPAALARLISPSTLVLQTTDSRGFARFAEFAGPAVAALVDDNAARFLHDPAQGDTSWRRIEIWKEAGGKEARVGGFSVKQQREEIALLKSLAAQPTLSPSPLGELVPSGADEVDRLTDWLLEESGLSGSTPA